MKSVEKEPEIMSIEQLKQRRSIRKYESRQVPVELLDQVLEAGTYAPTGMNRQSPVIVAIQDPEIIRMMERENGAVMGNPEGTPFYGAPTVIVVFADSRCLTGFEDACLVMGNMLNAAYALGLGSCWIHRAKETFQSEAGKKLMAQWGLDENYYGVGNCILGYSAETPALRPRKENYIIKVL